MKDQLSYKTAYVDKTVLDVYREAVKVDGAFVGFIGNVRVYAPGNVFETDMKLHEEFPHLGAVIGIGKTSGYHAYLKFSIQGITSCVFCRYGLLCQEMGRDCGRP